MKKVTYRKLSCSNNHRNKHRLPLQNDRQQVVQMLVRPSFYQVF